MIFRRRSGPVMRVAGAVDLLVYDSANPRSVVYQLDRLFDHLARLPDRTSSPGSRLDEQLLGRMATILQRTDAQQLAAVDTEDDQRSTLDTVVGEVDGLLGELLDNLRATFFVHERLSILAGGQPDRWNRPCEVPDRPPHALPLQRAPCRAVATKPISDQGTPQINTA